MMHRNSSELLISQAWPIGAVLFENSTAGFETDYRVPAGIKRVSFDVRGASGYGGAGGRVTGILKVKSGQILHFFVARARATDRNSDYNASDIRFNNIPLDEGQDWRWQRVVVAGGGGNIGVGGSYRAGGGIGGGLVGGGGASNWVGGGAGGSQTAGGGFGYGTEGGSGWYAGYNGGYGFVNKVGWCSGGCGGGSSYTHPDYCSDVVHEQGTSTAGYILIKVA